MWMLVTAFYVYTATMGQLCMSFSELADNAANLATLLFTMCLNFCGVLAGLMYYQDFGFSCTDVIHSLIWFKLCFLLD